MISRDRPTCVFALTTLAALTAWPVLMRAAPAAEDPAVAASVRELLQLGWQASPDARRAVDDRYTAVPPAVKSDPRVAYAYALALIKLRRDGDAAGVIAPIAAGHQLPPGAKPPLAVLHADLWLAVLLKQYDAALIKLERLAEVLGKTAAAAPSPEALETAERLGALFGFLEGPAEGSLPLARLDAHRTKITDPLGPPLAQAFAKGQDAVKQQHAQLVGDRAQAETDAEREAEAERKRLLDAALAERETLNQRRQELTDEIDHLRGELQSEQEAMRAAEQPVSEQWSVVSTTLRQQEADLVDVLHQIDRIEDLLHHSRDPRRRQQLLRELDQLDRLADRIRSEMIDLDREALLLESRLIELRREGQAIAARYARELTRRQAEQDKLARRESQLAGMEKRALGLKGDRGRSRALAVRASALTTYAPFPLEQEKQRLLDSL